MTKQDILSAEEIRAIDLLVKDQSVEMKAKINQWFNKNVEMHSEELLDLIKTSLPALHVESSKDWSLDGENIDMREISSSKYAYTIIKALENGWAKQKEVILKLGEQPDTSEEWIDMQMAKWEFMGSLPAEMLESEIRVKDQIGRTLMLIGGGKDAGTNGEAYISMKSILNGNPKWRLAVEINSEAAPFFDQESDNDYGEEVEVNDLADTDNDDDYYDDDEEYCDECGNLLEDCTCDDDDEESNNSDNEEFDLEHSTFSFD